MTRRPTMIALLVGAIIVVLVVGGGLVRHLGSDPARQPAGIAWGTTLPVDLSAAEARERSRAITGRDPSVLLAFVSTSLSPATLSSTLDRLRAQSRPGVTTLLTLEPGPTQGASSDVLAQIADGELDSLLRGVAGRLAGFRGPVALRFAHEMNGDWYPWAGDPTTYVAAWRHLHRVVHDRAPDVRFVWSVNAADVPNSNRFEAYWPGAGEVDVLGVDGYNCLAGWSDPAQLFDPALDRLSRLAPDLPVWITETASCEADAAPGAPTGASKAAWVTELFALAQRRRIDAVVWFDRDKERDWRMDTSATSASAIRRALAHAQ